MGGLGGRQPASSQSGFSTTTNKKLGNDPASPEIAKLKLMRKSSGMKPPPFYNKRRSESAVADSILPTTRDPPSKLAGLPFDAYKRAENKTVPAFDPGQSMVSASPVDKRFPPKPRRVLSGMVQSFFLDLYSQS